MLTDFQDKIHVVREQQNTQKWHFSNCAREYSVKLINTFCETKKSSCVVKSATSVQTLTVSAYFKVNLNHSDKFSVTCTEIIGLILMVELIIHQKPLGGFNNYKPTKEKCCSRFRSLKWDQSLKITQLVEVKEGGVWYWYNRTTAKFYVTNRPKSSSKEVYYTKGHLFL